MYSLCQDGTPPAPGRRRQFTVCSNTNSSPAIGLAVDLHRLRRGLGAETEDEVRLELQQAVDQLPARGLRLLPSEHVEIVRLAHIALRQALELLLLRVEEAARAFVLVRHRVDDDHLAALLHAESQRLEIIERAERCAEWHVLEFEHVGVVQHPPRLGIDSVDVAAGDRLDALRQAERGEGLAAT
jgi:hypothetical protein